ncbi:hypothetical protein T03_16945 [Trichinella britovi]|uniref:Uncharacterized protein n=1 Tax=Trichinella britovi TaxID=45882 RepID=A0A0V1D355_TRIBR|nr:hypothetical protein T03_16945 [Trichinella britovi]
MALNFHVKTCGGVFWLRQCFCYGNMRDNKDQMTVSSALVNLRPSVDRSTAFQFLSKITFAIANMYFQLTMSKLLPKNCSLKISFISLLEIRRSFLNFQIVLSLLVEFSSAFILFIFQRGLGCPFCILPLPRIYVHFVRVHIPTHQPPVEYEQADVSTANCNKIMPSTKIVSKADSTLICSKFMKRSVLVYTQIVLFKLIDQFELKS